jgi:hypothetical protein
MIPMESSGRHTADWSAWRNQRRLLDSTSRYVIGFGGSVIISARVGQEISRRGSFMLFAFPLSPLVVSAANIDIVTFPIGKITLHGVLYKPEGTRPFPAVVYNHGSAPGMLSGDQADRFVARRRSR